MSIRLPDQVITLTDADGTVMGTISVPIRAEADGSQIHLHVGAPPAGESAVELERAHCRAVTNTDLTSQVRLRDGDNCRFCGGPVNFNARTGPTAGTYLRLHAESAHDMDPDAFVVACLECNTRSHPPGVRPKLNLPPAEPRYSPRTTAMLIGRGLLPTSACVEPAECEPEPVSEVDDRTFGEVTAEARSRVFDLEQRRALRALDRGQHLIHTAYDVCDVSPIAAEALASAGCEIVTAALDAFRVRPDEPVQS